MTPYFDDGQITIYCGDSVEVMPALGVLADHVITDPPYDARTHRGARRLGKRGPEAIAIAFAPLQVAVMAPRLVAMAKRWTVAFCTMEMIALYQMAVPEAWIRAGFWRRPDGAPQFSGDRPSTPGDAIAIMHAPGRKRWNGGGRHAYYDVGVERRDRRHPTQKPEGLMIALVADYTDPGDLILDPYMGSGTTLLAAKRLGRRAIGIERDPEWCAFAVDRLRQGALGLEIPEPAQEGLALESFVQNA